MFFIKNSLFIVFVIVYLYGILDNISFTMGLGYLLSNDGSLELVFDGDYCWIHGVNDTDCGLVYDSSSGLLMDYDFENSHGAFILISRLSGLLIWLMNC